MKRFRPRFSLRTLAIVVTLACAYFGAWGVTRRHASGQVNLQPVIQTTEWPVSVSPAGKRPSRLIDTRERVIVGVSSPAPFLIRQDELETRYLEITDSEPKIDKSRPPTPFRRQQYYIWLLGPKVKPSVRTLTLLLTLVCVYIGAWQATRERGIPAIASSYTEFLVRASSSPAPFLLVRDELRPHPAPQHQPRCYYVWLFGLVFKIPYESQW